VGEKIGTVWARLYSEDYRGLQTSTSSTKPDFSSTMPKNVIKSTAYKTIIKSNS